MKGFISWFQGSKKQTNSAKLAKQRKADCVSIQQSLPPTTRPAKKSQKIGADAELAAQRFLRNKGWKLVEKNFLCKSGEIDLIMRHASLLVFFEVRYRTSKNYGGAAASVGYRKQQRILKTIQYYLQSTAGLSAHHTRYRIDVIEVTPLTSLSDKARDSGFQDYEINWIENAIQG